MDPTGPQLWTPHASPKANRMQAHRTGEPTQRQGMSSNVCVSAQAASHVTVPGHSSDQRARPGAGTLPWASTRAVSLFRIALKTDRGHSRYWAEPWTQGSWHTTMYRGTLESASVSSHRATISAGSTSPSAVTFGEQDRDDVLGAALDPDGVPPALAEPGQLREGDDGGVPAERGRRPPSARPRALGQTMPLGVHRPTGRPGTRPRPRAGARHGSTSPPGPVGEGLVRADDDGATGLGARPPREPASGFGG
jgi:hypothetical protein